METFSALLALCARNSPVTGEFPTPRPVTRSFDVFFGLRLNKRLSKQSWGWWFETTSRSLWRHCNGSSCVAQGCFVNIRYHQIWMVWQIWETFHIWCWASTWCCGQNLKAIGQLRNCLCANEISRNVNWNEFRGVTISARLCKFSCDFCLIHLHELLLITSILINSPGRSMISEKSQRNFYSVNAFINTPQQFSIKITHLLVYF